MKCALPVNARAGAESRHLFLLFSQPHVSRLGWRGDLDFGRESYPGEINHQIGDLAFPC